MVTVVQVAVAVVGATLVSLLLDSLAATVVLCLFFGFVLLVTMRKDPQRWRALRAITEFPPVFAPDGLRLRAASTSGYDLLVPWPQVSRIVASPRGQRWNLAVHIDDNGKLAGDDPVKRAALRKLQGPPGAGLIYRIGYVAADVTELDDVVQRLSADRLSVEQPAT